MPLPNATLTTAVQATLPSIKKDPVRCPLNNGPSSFSNPKWKYMQIQRNPIYADLSWSWPPPTRHAQHPSSASSIGTAPHPCVVFSLPRQWPARPIRHCSSCLHAARCPLPASLAACCNISHALKIARWRIRRIRHLRAAGGLKTPQLAKTCWAAAIPFFFSVCWAGWAANLRAKPRCDGLEACVVCKFAGWRHCGLSSLAAHRPPTGRPPYRVSFFNHS